MISKQVIVNLAGRRELFRLNDGKPEMWISPTEWKPITRLQLGCGHSVSDTQLIEIINKKLNE